MSAPDQTFVTPQTRHSLNQEKKGEIMPKNNSLPPIGAASSTPGAKSHGNFPPPPNNIARSHVAFGTIRSTAGQRVVIYGTGGIGKTTLAAQMPSPVAFIDLDDSLRVLKPRFDDQGITPNIMPVDGITDWTSLLNALNADGWDAVKTIVIDTVTRAELMCEQYVVATHTNDKGAKVDNIEGFGFGKGYTIKADEFNALLGALDRHARSGRNVVLICHDCVCNVPNPNGEDWIRYEPRLQNPPSGKSSIRAAVKEWCDHMLFVGYDVTTDKNGKGKGGGTRTIYTTEHPHCMAKSRTTDAVLPINGAFDWGQIIK